MDIEELARHPALPDAARSAVDHNLVVRPAASLKRNRVAQEPSPPDSEDSDDNQDAVFRPGRETVLVKTWGCAHNNSDGEYMAGLLAAAGYTVVTSDADRARAAVWVLNGCTVKGPSEHAFANMIDAAAEGGKRVVVAGCVPAGAPSDPRWNNLSAVGVQQIHRVVHVVEETLQGHTVRLTDKGRPASDRAPPPLALPKVRRNALVEIVPLNAGCLSRCTYCKTKHARGDLVSYAPDALRARVRQVLAEGVAELWLTSEDTGAYGRDIGVSIVELLEGLVAEVDAHGAPHVRVRLGMTNPPYILEHLDGIARVLRHPRVYRFLHVPVQAGSDKVLDDMRREYTRAQFCHIVSTLRALVPGITIATDIICGFPTESEDDFAETLALLRDCALPVVHISRFYPRPGTPAAKMPPLPSRTVKARSRAATDIVHALEPYPALVGSLQTVLVTETAADGVSLVGHDSCYRQVLLPHDASLLGRMVSVRITGCGRWSLFGEVDVGVSGGALEGLSEGVIRHRKRGSAKRLTPGDGDLAANGKEVPSGSPSKSRSQSPSRPLNRLTGATPPGGSNIAVELVMIVAPALFAAYLLASPGTAALFGERRAYAAFRAIMIALLAYGTFLRVRNAVRRHGALLRVHTAELARVQDEQRRQQQQAAVAQFAAATAT